MGRAVKKFYGALIAAAIAATLVAPTVQAQSMPTMDQVIEKGVPLAIGAVLGYGVSEYTRKPEQSVPSVPTEPVLIKVHRSKDNKEVVEDCKLYFNKVDGKTGMHVKC